MKGERDIDGKVKNGERKRKDKREIIRRMY
jgi:hypothetical protein